MNTVKEPSAAQKLLTNLYLGWGYNAYNRENQLRADDLCIRARVDEILGHAASGLSRMDSEYRKKYLPPPTFENPFPDARAVAYLRELERTRKRLDAIRAVLRGSSAPSTNTFRQRYQTEAETLAKLREADNSTVALAQNLEDLVCQGKPVSAIAPILESLETAITERNLLSRVL